MQHDKWQIRKTTSNGVATRAHGANILMKKNVRGHQNMWCDSETPQCWKSKMCACFSSEDSNQDKSHP